MALVNLTRREFFTGGRTREVSNNHPRRTRCTRASEGRPDRRRPQTVVDRILPKGRQVPHTTDVRVSFGEPAMRKLPMILAVNYPYIGLSTTNYLPHVALVITQNLMLGPHSFACNVIRPLL